MKEADAQEKILCVRMELHMKEDKRGPRTNRTQNIIQAAYSVILEQGYCNTSTSMIAQKAGLTKSMLHYYFKDKDMLMLDTNRYAIQKLIDLVKKVASQYPDDPDRMDKWITKFWKIIKKNIDIITVLYATSINSLNDPRVRMEFGEFYGMILKEVTKHIISEYERLNVSQKDAEAVASIIMGVMESLIHHYMVNPNITDFDYSVKMLIRIITTTMPISSSEG
jgi:AcrR family transcriptional regulator